MVQTSEGPPWEPHPQSILRERPRATKGPDIPWWGVTSVGLCRLASDN